LQAARKISKAWHRDIDADDRSDDFFDVHGDFVKNGLRRCGRESSHNGSTKLMDREFTSAALLRYD